MLKSLESPSHFDVIVLGGGVIGAAIAYELSKKGTRVLVLEKNNFGAGASGASAAMLEVQTDAHRGEPFVSFAKESMALFPSLYEEIKSNTGIDFEFEQKGILQVALSEADAEQLEVETLRQKEFALKASWLSSKELKKKVPHLGQIQFGGVFYHGDGQVNATFFTHGLIKAAELNGTIARARSGPVTIYPGDPIEVSTPTTTYKADKVILATGAWTDLILKNFGIKLGVAPIKGQLLVYETPQRLFDFPIYTSSRGYVCPKQGYTLVGSTMEKTGYDKTITQDGFNQLKEQAEKLVPSLADLPVYNQTAALRPGSPDELPFIGPLEDHPNIIIATGHFRNGMLLAPITAKVVSDLVTNHSSSIDIAAFSLLRNQTVVI